MNRFALGLLVATATIGFAIACSPHNQQTLDDNAPIAGEMDKNGNIVWLKDEGRSSSEQDEQMLTQAYIGNKQSCEQDKDAESCALMKENEAALRALQAKNCREGDQDACELAKPNTRSAYTGAYDDMDGIAIINELPAKKKACDRDGEDSDACRFLANAEQALADRCVDGDKLACENADKVLIEAARDEQATDHQH